MRTGWRIFSLGDYAKSPNVSPTADPIKCSSTWQKTAKRRHLAEWKIPPSVKTHMGLKTRQVSDNTLETQNSPTVKSRQVSENTKETQNSPTVRTRQLYDNLSVTKNPATVQTRQLC